MPNLDNFLMTDQKYCVILEKNCCVILEKLYCVTLEKEYWTRILHGVNIH